MWAFWGFGDLTITISMLPGKMHQHCEAHTSLTGVTDEQCMQMSQSIAAPGAGLLGIMSHYSISISEEPYASLQAL